jgi:GNAT superfamily N-acetyltransferase
MEIVAAEPERGSGLLRAYMRSLVAPLDDMWATFAEMADPFVLLLDGEPAGLFSVDDEGQLHRFYVQPALLHRAHELLRHVLSTRPIRAALPSTVDPAFTSLSLGLSEGVEVKALMFHRVVGTQPVGPPLKKMRRAKRADLDASVVFEHAATGAPLAFLRSYLEARIASKELLLHEVNGAIVGIGELRPDRATGGYAHLGVIVGESARGQGLGGVIMNYLVRESGRQALRPVCSTEPTNLAARRVIERAGFRARHRVLRVVISEGR